MGWLWSRSTPADSKPTIQSPSATSPPPKDAASPPPAADKPRALTRDEQAEAELQSFLRELESPSSSPSTPATSSSSTPPSLRPNHDPDSIHPSALYPTTMSCRAAFDAAYTCQLPGGQFTNIYRYGQLRDCSELWSNFWFCMRTNRSYMSEEERQEKIRQHYWERDEKYRKGPNSEDVWSIREKKVQRPFMGDFEAYEREVRDAEEGERRKA